MIAFVIRRIDGQHCRLDLGNRTVIAGAAWPTYNPGAVAVDQLRRVPNVSLEGVSPHADVALPVTAKGC
jgi:hypothetical protein